MRTTPKQAHLPVKRIAHRSRKRTYEDGSSAAQPIVIDDSPSIQVAS